MSYQRVKRSRESPLNSPSAPRSKIPPKGDDTTDGGGAESRAIGVLTSGGDSQGMNAAVRATVRMAIFKGCKVFGIREGYNGLINDWIDEYGWNDVSAIMQKGGTRLGTARCMEFMTWEGKLKAAKNLVKRGICNLVVIGGDGSLTGANIFHEQWGKLTEELRQKGMATASELEKVKRLNIVGMVGSIDNDFCGTDMTIGTDSALHRILEAVDCITSTAASHQRSFILEVMGRHCGYLALMSALACLADWVFVPEDPPGEGWQTKMCDELQKVRDAGRRYSIIIIAEGAVDKEGRPIKSADVKEVLVSRLQHDTRITSLGHVQRGGTPSAYDRILGCRWGAAAVLALLDFTPSTEPCVVTMQGNQIKRLSLMECVRKTKDIGRLMSNKQFDECTGLRGDSFAKNLKLFKRLRSSKPPDDLGDKKKFCFGVMNTGAPAAGMNACVCAFTRFALYHGHSVKAIYDGFDGLKEGKIEDLGWMAVNEWSGDVGSNLGTNRGMPAESSFSAIAHHLSHHGIQALLVIGGFEAFHSVLKLHQAREQHAAFRIPILCIPATISNNVPGTDISLGSDTALNAIVEALDVVKKSASSNRRRVFIVETMGGYCGYLATMAAIAGGADSAYIFEESFTIADLQKDLAHMIDKFKTNILRGTIVRNEKCSEHYTTDFLTSLYNAEGHDVFVARELVLGHLQQGNFPSPFDRSMGAKYAVRAVEYLSSQVLENSKQDGTVSAVGDGSASVLGIRGRKMVCTPVSELAKKTDFKYRLPLDQWWIQLRPLLKILARYKELEFKGEQLSD